MSMKDLFSLAGRVAVVTGGSRGIGKMIARGFLEYGAKVYITARKAEACDAAAEELSSLGTCISMPHDLATIDGCRAFVAALGERERAIHALVNNAGAAWAADFDEFPEHGWDKVMNLNVKSPFFLTQALLPLLEAAASAEDPARIIMIGSVDGLHVNRLPTYSYGPSKAAVHHLARTLASHLASRHITVNAIAPGLFPTKMTATTIERIGESIRESTPLRRYGRAEDMAGIAIYLASKAGSFVTGAVIPVDGGLTGAKGTL